MQKVRFQFLFRFFLSCLITKIVRYNMTFMKKPAVVSDFSQISSLYRIRLQDPPYKISRMRLDIFGKFYRRVDDVADTLLSIDCFQICRTVGPRDLTGKHEVLHNISVFQSNAQSTHHNYADTPYISFPALVHMRLCSFRGGKIRLFEAIYHQVCPHVAFLIHSVKLEVTHVGPV